ncbi:hypothetical protein [Pseudomonas viridiflava]|uniref:hypothetical protein n=1 Tax=Pseudomonas viridiflava TaxID=33069 RepID=UPI000F051D3F|nr:hypothetical protein [Pseudomonas viridiflava]
MITFLTPKTYKSTPGTRDIGSLGFLGIKQPTICIEQPFRLTEQLRNDGNHGILTSHYAYDLIAVEREQDSDPSIGKRF